MPDTQFAPFNRPARKGRLVALLALALSVTSCAWALGPQDSTAAWPDQAGWWGATHLIDIRQGSSLSKTARDLRDGGYELANGDTVDFRQWYSARWTDVGVTWMTQLTPRWGLIWGFSTGERGAKYTIDPSLKWGFLFQQPTGRNAWLSVRYTTAFGGRLRERSCTADYGAIRGVQAVNCRLAGVEGNKTGLYGTSFAAPVISGYSAVLGSKFTAASATQITNQLLNTARIDTIANYNKAVHGRGEASLSRALAPVTIR